MRISCPISEPAHWSFASCGAGTDRLIDGTGNPRPLRPSRCPFFGFLRCSADILAHMRILVRLIACFLIAWLPMLGYPAQVTSCPQMSATGMQQSSCAVSMAGMKHHARASKISMSKLAPACHGCPGSSSCGMPFLISRRTDLAVSASPVYRDVSRALVAQFISAPPQRPPQAL